MKNDAECDQERHRVIGGHVAPSKRLLETVSAYVRQLAAGLILDHNISSTGDDIAILMTHTRGEGDGRGLPCAARIKCR